MRTIPKSLLAAGAVLALVPALAACDTDENAAATPSITDVNPADWVNPMYTDHYTWAYATADGNRICTAFPARSGYPAGISCSANFPADAPEVKNDVFVGPPNTVVLTKDGVQITIDEGGPFTPKVMPENHRITVGELRCTTLPEHGIQCASSTAGFTADNGTVTQTGEIIAPSTAPASTATTTTTIPSTTAAETTSSTPPAVMDGPYTEGPEPVAPGTMCGVASGNTPVQVVSGSISCIDAIAVIDGYLAAPDDGSHGNARIKEYQGWSCSAPTYGTSQQLGYTAKCTKGGIELIRPTFG